MKLTTYGMLSFEDCEVLLREDLVPKFFCAKEEAKRYHTILLSEIPIDIAEINIGEFCIRPLPCRKSDPFKPFALVLRVPQWFDVLTAPLVSEAFAALMSFAFRRRVKSYRKAFEENKTSENHLPPDVFIYLPSISVGPSGSLQRPLVLDEQNRRARLLDLIYAKLMKMKKEEYLATVRSLHLYQLALLSYREDVSLAYTLLVSSIETMAQQFVKKIDVATFNALHDAGWWNKLFRRRKLSTEIADEIRNHLFKREHFSSLRFRRFIMTNLPESFWSSPDSRAKEFDYYIESMSKDFSCGARQEQQEHFNKYWWLYDPSHRITREEFEDVLLRVYALRSTFSHIGRSASAEVLDLYETAELRPKIGEGGRKPRIELTRALPSFFWFERVAHESISNFIQHHK